MAWDRSQLGFFCPFLDLSATFRICCPLSALAKNSELSRDKGLPEVDIMIEEDGQALVIGEKRL